MEDFLSDQNVIRDMPTRYITDLIWANPVLQEGSNPGDNNLGDDFVDGAAKTNRSEEVHKLRTLSFRHKSDQSMIKTFRNNTVRKSSRYQLKNFSTTEIPMLLKKKGQENHQVQGF